ncbi:four-carbon acid sugar kinase family protein [Orrella sp. JC864]|uniref:four-carbon acid sugar kinase family protein n=1 Tax=Orrella sp. JC864 TaxID=3120298 RepID=UPI003008641E
MTRAAPPAKPAYGWYGDDFTGATDTLATLAQAGLRTQLFLDVPGPQALAEAGPLDAIGIAGVARALPAQALQAELAPVGRYFASAGVSVLHYKVCSTFDSAAHAGNIAAAIAALHPYVQDSCVPIVGGQPSLGRYCVFGNLYARAGADGQVHRIDRHPTMSRHPVTPMGEADLLRHLRALGLPEGAALHYPDYAQPAGQLDTRLSDLMQALRDSAPAYQAILLDVAEPAHLSVVGGLIARRAARARLLAVGASSVAQAWLAAQPGSPQPVPGPLALAPAQGPVFVLAGSLSPVTARQIANARCYERQAADPLRWLADERYRQDCLQRARQALQAGRNVLVHTAQAGAHPDAAATTHAAQATAAFVAQTVAAMAAAGRPLRRIGVAGGDTSSLATRALALRSLSYRAALGAGVTVCRAHSADPVLDGLELMLKGGQVGAPDLFDRLVTG